jgi:polar amino acid transport system permease protein
MLVTNDAFEWRFMFDNALTDPVLAGARTTLIVTIVSMLVGVALGIVIAVARLSPNPIVSTAAWLYTWFFRAVPRLVLMILFGNFGILYSRYEFGVPFDRQIGDLLGITFDGRFAGLSARDLVTGVLAGTAGLALSEAAYMAEIVRAGIQSVDPGQTEAAQALGMSRIQVLRRIVLPQAMRVIVPPTGNEVINMLKTTSLVSAVQYPELLRAAQDIGQTSGAAAEMLFLAAAWYLILTTVFSIGQFYLERYYARGSSRALPPTPWQKVTKNLSTFRRSPQAA